MLEVRLIGTFEIKCDGKHITIPSRIAQSLFAYLILSAGDQHRREKLAGMFWPDVSEKNARAYLRYALWHIRKALSAVSRFDYLLTDDINISFNSSANYWLDVSQLKNAGNSASVDELMNALSIFQGELLPGFYENWITEEREHLQSLYEQRITRLLELLEKNQRWNDVLEWAERWISFGHASEAAYRALMVAYDALGDRAKVTATYERCVQALRELDLEPSEQTRALADKRTSKLNIPIPLTTFIGREKELREIADLLSKSRLVTLTGSGGVGKTRLSVQVVADVLDNFPDGVWFLDLAPVTDFTLVPTALANLLKLRESGEVPVIELLINYFRSRTALVIFDNCEHLIEACAQLIHLLLTSCEYLSVLATSREALHVSGETSYRVPSLEIPGLEVEPTIDHLAKIESVKLFIQRASAISPRFALVPQNAFVTAQICQRLDGIPLAIELAAARTNMLSVRQILARLDDRFNLLTRGLRTSLPRHQTLRETIEWSYNLLSEKERLLFRRLAVFVGGWTLEAAEEVCSGNGIESGEVLDLISQLVDKSLLLIENVGNEPRYHRLETIRQFAREKLFETTEATRLQERHLEYFLKLAETAEPHLRRTEQIEWLKRLEAEHDNLRAALTYAMDKPSAEYALRLAGALGYYWQLRPHELEGARWLDQALGKAWDKSSKTEKSARAKALYGRAEIAGILDETDLGKTFAESALALCEEVQDLWGIAHSRMLVATYKFRLRMPEATIRPLLEQSLREFQSLGDAWGESWTLGWLAALLIERQSNKEFLESMQRAIARARDSGDRESTAFMLSGGLFINLINHDEWDEAEKFLKEGERLYAEIDSLGAIEVVRYRQLALFMARREFETAKVESKQVIERSSRIGEKNFQSTALTYLAIIAEAENDFRGALTYAQEALTLQRNIGVAERIALGLMFIGLLQYEQGNAEFAIQSTRESLEFVRQGDVAEPVILKIFDYLAGLFVEKEPQTAVRILAFTDALARLSSLRKDAIFDKPYFERFLTAARAKLSEAEFASAWEAGSKMSLDEAVAYALKELQ